MGTVLGLKKGDIQAVPVGQILLQKGLISPEQLDEILALQEAWGSRVGRILLGKGYVTAQQLYSALAEHYGLPFVDLIQEPPDKTLLQAHERQDYLDLGVMPWRRNEDGRTVLAVTAIDQPVIKWVEHRYGSKGFELVITSSFDITWQVQEHFSSEDDLDARERLWEQSPQDSAKQTLTGRQKAWLVVIIAGLALGFVREPLSTAIVIGLVVNAFYLATFLLKLVLTWAGADQRVDIQVTDKEVRALKDAELPEYTILVPLYREANVLPGLVDSLRGLDYPMSKLDIKLILEEDDLETIEAAKSLACESIFEIIRVPPSNPKTKPKACNYALRFARGELVTIYDAEDRPEADQLKKVVAAFRKASSNTACIQARLNYYNMRENFLTKSFTLEYSQWFDFLLPGLDALRIPIPLGGTSNHLKLKVLRELGAWDPYNVTEDADLGVRLTKAGHRVGVVNSTTFEEANSRLGNWLRQRSRWLKGYMQTYLVHMRRPIQLYRSLGYVGFWGFQFFIGGPPLVAAINPILWTIFALWLFGGPQYTEALFPPIILYLALVNLLLGNLMYIYFGIVALFKRHYVRLIPYALLQPAYWALHSFAVYKGIFQLLINPHFWEKTVHGLSALTKGAFDGRDDEDGQQQTGSLKTTRANIPDHDRRKHSPAELFSHGTFLALSVVLGVLAVLSIRDPVIQTQHSGLLARLGGQTSLADLPLFQTVGEFLPLLLVKMITEFTRAGPVVINIITAVAIAAVLAFIARSLVRRHVPHWEAALLILVMASHPLLLFGAASGTWVLMPAVGFMMITLWVYRVEIIGDVQSKMTLGLVLGVLALSEPNILYVILPLVMLLPWADSGIRSSAEAVAAWVLMLMPAVIAISSFLLAVDILFGVSPVEMIMRWAAPLHGTPWLFYPSVTENAGTLTPFSGIQGMLVIAALGVPFAIVPLMYGIGARDISHAPRTALLSVVLPVIAGTLAVYFGHMATAWSILLMLMLGSLAWLSKASLSRPIRLTVIGLFMVSSATAWISPILWQDPMLASWRNTLWQLLS